VLHMVPIVVVAAAAVVEVAAVDQGKLIVYLVRLSLLWLFVSHSTAIFVSSINAWPNVTFYSSKKHFNRISFVIFWFETNFSLRLILILVASRVLEWSLMIMICDDSGVISDKIMMI
jgi:hypothetical protein